MMDNDKIAIQEALDNHIAGGEDIITESTPTPDAVPTEAPEAPVEPVKPEAAPEAKEDEKPADPVKPKNNWAKLLGERNQARREAESSAQIIAEQALELQAAKDKIKELQGKDVSEDEAGAHDLEIIDTIAKKNVLEANLNSSKNSLDKQFYKDIPEAMEIKDKLDAIIQKHPTMNHYDAFAMYAGTLGENIEAKVEKPDEQKENQKKDYDLLGTPHAGDSKSGDMSGMSTQDMKAALQKVAVSGELTL